MCSKKHIQYYLNIAKEVSKASTCLRWQVGAVIVKNDCIASTWYNWAARWIKSCKDEGECYMIHGHCERTLHAEENAIIQAARLWVSIYWATMYCTTKPCYRCIQRLINAWIEKIIFINDYKGEYPFDISELNILYKYNEETWQMKRL